MLFKTGPLAWGGLLSFWAPAVDDGSFILLMSWATYRAVNKAPAGADTPELVTA